MSTMRPVSSASGMNSRRLHQPARGVLPAHEPFDADDRPRGQIDGGLVVEHEILFDTCSAKVGDELQPTDDVFVHSRRVDDVLRLAASLRPVHGDVGGAKQLVCVVSDRDPDARGDEHLSAVELEGLLQVRDHPLGSIHGGRDLHVLEQDGELVTAQAGDGVTLRARRPEGVRRQPARVRHRPGGRGCRSPS